MSSSCRPARPGAGTHLAVAPGIHAVADGFGAYFTTVYAVVEDLRCAYKEHRRLVLLYVLGPLGDPGQAYLHQVMGLCRNYDARITDRWLRRLQPGRKPIRCSTLREWLRDLLPGVTCSCRLSEKSGSPLGLASAGPRTVERPQETPDDGDWGVIAGDVLDDEGSEGSLDGRDVRYPAGS